MLQRTRIPVTRVYCIIVYSDRICKLLRSPGIDSKELPNRPAKLHRQSESTPELLTSLQIRAQCFILLGGNLFCLLKIEWLYLRRKLRLTSLCSRVRQRVCPLSPFWLVSCEVRVRVEKAIWLKFFWIFFPLFEHGFWNIVPKFFHDFLK